MPSGSQTKNGEAAEAKRLAALKRYAILDTLPELVFDELTRMVGECNHAPSAVISFVDERRVWYKSRLNFEPTELHREFAPCHWVVKERGVVSVSDTLTDARFRNLPCVKAVPGVRAYHGAPLVTMDGQIIGALALKYDQPTPLSPQGLEMLRVVSRQVMTQLELRRHLVQLSRTFEEQRRAEDALRSSEAFFQALVDSLPQRIIRKDLDGKFTFASSNFCVELGKTLKDICGKTDFDFFPRDLAEKYHRDDEQVISSRAAFEAVEEHQLPDGSKGFVQVVKTPLIDVHGKVVGVQGIFWDVTEQRRTEQELARERDLLRALLTHIPDRLFFKDAQSRFIKCSTSMSASLGFKSPDEVIGKTDFDYYPPEMARGFFDEEQQIIRTGQPLISKIQHHMNEAGQEVWSAVTKVPISNHRGLITGIVGLSRDISKLMQAEQALRQTEEKYRNIVENSVEGFFQTTADGHYITANHSLAQIYGYPSPEELKRAMTDIQHQLYVDPNRREEFRRLMREQGEVTGFESEIFRKNGDVIWISESARAVCNERGELLDYEGSVEDISARKRADQARESAHEAALESARVKAQFLANMSHEFRTPLNAIIGNASVLLSGRVNQEQRELVEPIVESAEALNRLINDILDFSKMEAGKLKVERIDYDLRELVEGTAEMLAQNARNQGDELVCWIAHEVPDFVEGDPIRVRQVLMNLLSNAIKFTRRGEVTLKCTMEPGVGGISYVRFEVKDTGVGIDEKSKPIIFQAFTQADGSTTRRFGGTGLGLTISKQIVEMMGGTIGFESELGKGSLFWFQLPWAPARSISVSAPWSNQAGLQGKRVWVLDDHPLTRHALASYLSASGLVVETSGSVLGSLERFQQDHAAGRSWNVVLVDSDMPEADGLTVARRIRESESLAGLRIVMLTLPGCAPEQSLMQALSISACVSKPVKRGRLIEAIAASLNNSPIINPQQEHSGRSETPAPDPRLSKLRILVAEDNPVNQQVATRMLRALGCTADLASDGNEVLRALEQNAYDLVLMDCQMPELDGYATARRIREDLVSGTPRLKAHPFLIAVTANAMMGDRERCLAAGMHDYLSKPLKLGDLASVLRRASECVGGDAMPLQSVQSAPSPVSVSSGGVQAAADGEPSLDTSIIQGLRELREPGQSDPLRQLTELFLRDSEPRIAHIRRGVEANDPSVIVGAAHALKGSASNLGARKLAAWAGAMEKHAKGGDLAAANSIVDSLVEEFRRVQSLLQAEVER